MTTDRGRTRRRASVTTVLCTLGLVAGSLAPATGAAAETPPQPEATAAELKIHATLHDDMAAADPGELVEALVVLDATSDLAPTASRKEVTGTLARTAASSQAPVAELVRAHGGRVRSSFWLQNMLLVAAPPAALSEVAEVSEVDRLISNMEVTVPEPDESVAPAEGADATWGLAKIGADRVQDELGYGGDGVRVAVLDTGIDMNHPDLAGKMATDDPSDPRYPGGWIEFGPDGQPVSSEPHDSADHGTHVAGTIAGGDASGARIGVAPEAELMGALVIPGGTGTLAQVVAGMEWAVDPVDADGNPAGQPADVVNLSLGACGLASEMVAPTRNMRAAGVFPAFAIGNSGFDCPDCGPVDSSSPGNVYGSVGVGATDPDDNVADFSCGAVLESGMWPGAPADWPERYVKPDLSAPGVGVMSAAPGGGYIGKSGTSMATPHVAGAVALLHAARPGITVDAAQNVLAGNSFFDERYGQERPNPRFGQGRIDAYAAVTEAALRSGVRGTVTHEATGEPLPGVTVTNLDNGRSYTSDADGGFELWLPAGEYTLVASHFGFRDATLDVTVTAQGYTTAAVSLAPAPHGSITGTVAYEPTGASVPGAVVRVQDVPSDLSATTDRHGRYEITGVPAGDYELAAQGLARARSEAVGVSVVAHERVEVDLALARLAPTELLSLSSDGGQGNGASWWPSISDDGRYVAFGSTSTTLAGGSDNGEWDLFRRDRLTGLTERVSVAQDGGAANGFSLSPRISADGRYVGFNSSATNLTEGSAAGVTDAYVRDLEEGVTELLTVAHDGGAADGGSSAPKLSADGRYAVFGSDATNLVPDDDNGRHDIFVRDRHTGTTERVSQAYGGGDANDQSREADISADGRYVAFHSDASDLVAGGYDGPTAVFVHDRETGQTRVVTGPGDGPTRSPDLSADGRTVSFDHRLARFGLDQIYVQDLETGENELVSVSHDGEGGADYYAYGASLSADGGVVTYHSGASNLVEGDTNGVDDVFVRDLASGTTERVTTGLDGAVNDDSALPVVSGDGRYIAFQSDASNLVHGDANDMPDIFLYDREGAAPQARFVVGELEVRQQEVKPRQPVIVMARIKNVGGATGEYEAVLRVDGQVVESDTVRVRPDKWTWAKFQLRPDEVGSFHVAVGSAIGTFTVSR